MNIKTAAFVPLFFLGGGERAHTKTQEEEEEGPRITRINAEGRGRKKKTSHKDTKTQRPLGKSGR